MRAIAITWMALAATAAGDEAKVDATRDAQSDSQSSSSTSVSTQTSKDGKTTTSSAKRTVKDGKVVEAEGDLALLDGLVKGGANVDDLERMVRELAKLDAAGAKAGSDAKTRKYVKVVKDGKVVEESGDPSLARDLGLGELKKLGVDVAGLDAMVESLVREALDGAKAGRPLDAPALKKKLELDGLPVDATVEVKSGADALKELGKRCPELKGDLERQLGRVGGEFRARLDRAREAQQEKARAAENAKAKRAEKATGGAPRVRDAR